MLHLTNVIDRATGYVFVPKTSPDSTTEGVRKEDGASLEPSAQPNEYALFSSAMGAMPSLVGGKGGRAYDVRDVQVSLSSFFLICYILDFLPTSFSPPYG